MRLRADRNFFGSWVFDKSAESLRQGFNSEFSDSKSCEGLSSLLTIEDDLVFRQSCFRESIGIFETAWEEKGGAVSFNTRMLHSIKTVDRRP
jgi:hypothetical protein